MNRCLFISSFLHLLFAAVILVLGLIAPPERKILPDINARLISPRGPNVGAPKHKGGGGGSPDAKDLPPPPKPADTPKPAASPKPAATPKPEPTKAAPKPTEQAKKPEAKPQATPEVKKAPTTEGKKIIKDVKDKEIVMAATPKPTPAKKEEPKAEPKKEPEPPGDSRSAVEIPSSVRSAAQEPSAPAQSGENKGPGVEGGKAKEFPGLDHLKIGPKGNDDENFFTLTGDTYAYFALLKIQQNFKPPYSLPGATAIVQFKIMKDGAIMDAKIRSSSGRSDLDQSAIRALLDTERLQELYDDYGKPYVEVEVTFEFEQS